MSDSVPPEDAVTVDETVDPTWVPEWPALEVLQRGHLRRVWLAPELESEDPKLWPHQPYYLDPGKVLGVMEEPRSTPWSTSTLRLHGLIIPIDVLGTPEQVFYLLGLGDPTVVPPIDPSAFGDRRYSAVR